MKKVKVKDLVIGRVYDIYFKGELIIDGKQLSRANKFFFNFSESCKSQRRNKNIYHEGRPVVFEDSFPYDLPSVHTFLRFGDIPLELEVQFGERDNLQYLEFYEHVEEKTLEELAKKEAELLKELAEIHKVQKRLKFSF